MDLIDIYRTFHPKEYTFFSSVQRIGHMLNNKTNLNTVEIISSSFSNCNGMKLEIPCKRKSERKKGRKERNKKPEERNPQYVEIKQNTAEKPMSRRNQKSNEKYLHTNENITYQNLWHAAKAVLRGKFTIHTYLIKQAKSQTSTLYLKELEKEEQSKPKVIGGKKERTKTKKQNKSELRGGSLER